MNLLHKEWKRKRTELGQAIREGNAERVDSLLADGVVPRRNQFELAARRALDSTDDLPHRLSIVRSIFIQIRRDRHLTAYASRYVECTLITLGAHNNPIRKMLMDILGIVPGEAAKKHYGVYTKNNLHTAFEPC